MLFDCNVLPADPVLLWGEKVKYTRRLTWSQYSLLLKDLNYAFYLFSFSPNSGSFSIRIQYVHCFQLYFATLCHCDVKSLESFADLEGGLGCFFPARCQNSWTYSDLWNRESQPYMCGRQWTKSCIGRRSNGCLNVHHWSKSVLLLLGDTHFHINLLCIVISTGYNHCYNHTLMLWFFWL